MRIMKIKNIYAGLVLTVFLAFTSSCEDDFLDINEDPNNPSQVSLQLLLPGTQAAMATNLGHSTLGLSQEPSAIVQQLVNFRIGTYNLITGTSYTNQWLGAFSNALSNNEQIIEQATASGDLAYVGVAQLQKAFMYSVLVDLFGDLPYTEALQDVENLAPRFDDDETIYTDLFRLIDEGIANLEQTSLQTPGPNGPLSAFVGRPSETTLTSRAATKGRARSPSAARQRAGLGPTFASRLRRPGKRPCLPRYPIPDSRFPDPCYRSVGLR